VTNDCVLTVGSENVDWCHFWLGNWLELDGHVLLNRGILYHHTYTGKDHSTGW